MINLSTKGQKKSGISHFLAGLIGAGVGVVAALLSRKENRDKIKETASKLKEKKENLKKKVKKGK